MSAVAPHRAIILALAALALLAGCGKKVNPGGYTTDTRNAIRAVGSPLVFPFTAAVAEQFALTHPDYRAPVVESTGTANGVRLFCGGVGLRFPDIVGTSRRLLPAEAEACLRHGVTRIAEIEIGSVASAGVPWSGPRPLFLYIKIDHLKLIDGLRPLLANYAHDWNPGGPLAQIGLVPASAAIRARSAAIAKTLPPIDLSAIRRSSH